MFKLGDEHEICRRPTDQRKVIGRMTANEKPNSAWLLESLKQQIQQGQRIQPMGQNLLEV